MGIGEPRSFAGALPGMLAGERRKPALRRMPYPSPRSIKPDSLRSACCQRENGCSELTVQINHQFVARGSQFGDKPSSGGEGGQARLPEVRRNALGIKHHVVKGRVMANEFGDRRLQDPVDACRRIVSAQPVQKGKGVYHIADRRQLDQQNSTRLPILTISNIGHQKSTRRATQNRLLLYHLHSVAQGIVTISLGSSRALGALRGAQMSARNRVNHALHGAGDAMPQHSDALVLLRSDPVELYNPANADERLVAVP